MSPSEMTAASSNHSTTSWIFPTWSTSSVEPWEWPTEAPHTIDVLSVVCYSVLLIVITIATLCGCLKCVAKRMMKRRTAVVVVGRTVPVAPSKPSTRLAVLSQRTVVLVPVPSSPASGASTIASSRQDTTTLNSIVLTRVQLMSASC